MARSFFFETDRNPSPISIPMNATYHPILAQESTPPAAPPAGGDAPAKPQNPGGMGQMLPMMLLMMVIFYFVLIRPQRKQQKELEKKREGIQIGDDVVTIGGIHGRVTNKSDRTVTVKVADSTKIKFEKTAINQVYSNNKEDKSDEAEEAEEAPSEEDSK